MSAADETFELAVQLRGENIDETTAGLEDVEQSFDETAQSVDDSSDEMEGFAAEWDGAMQAILAGLAVAAVGLASQIPVVGELMAGLEEIIAAVAFQMDSVLRPVLEPLTEGFFKIADAIFNAEGPLGSLIGILGTLLAVFVGIVVPLAALIAKFTAFSGAAAVLKAAAAALISPIVAIASALGLPVIAVAALIAALIALIAVFVTDFMGIRTAVVNAATGVINAITGLAGDIGAAFAQIVSDALQWGRDLMHEFAQGITDAASAPLDAASDALADITASIGFDVRANDRMAERWGRDLMSHFSIGMERGQRHDLPTEGVSGGRSDASPPATATDNVQVLLDGKRVDKGTRRHRGDETSPRGRHS